MFEAFLIIIFLLSVFNIAKYQRRRSLYRLSPALKMQIRNNSKSCCEILKRYQDANLKYVVQSVIPDSELRLLIDSGIESSDLDTYIRMKINQNPGLTLGFKISDNNKIDIKLSKELKDKHAFILGETGSGKTTLILHLIEQLIKKDEGIGAIIIEPETAQSILEIAYRYRPKDVIYFDPRLNLGINPLQLKNRDENSINLAQSALTTILFRLMEDKTPRMRELISQTVYAFLINDAVTMKDMIRFLRPGNEEYRNTVLKSVYDQDAKDFWYKDYPGYGNAAYLPLVHRLGEFLKGMVKNVLCNNYNNLDLGWAMNNRKIVVINLSDGLIGPMASKILGRIFIVMIELTILARANIINPMPFYWFVDEFHEFAEKESLLRILKRVRKRAVRFWFATQDLSGIDNETFDSIKTNCKIKICFNTSHDDAKKMCREFLIPDNGGFKELPVSQILNLNTGQCIVKLNKAVMKINTYNDIPKPRNLDLLTYNTRDYKELEPAKVF